VSDPVQRASLVSAASSITGSIDILVLNAAVSPAPGMVLDTEESIWDKIFDINLKAPFLLSKEVKPFIPGGGSIIFVSSVAAYDPKPVRLSHSFFMKS
jgi:dehydrogenase/reductase SDR family protein 4